MDEAQEIINEFLIESNENLSQLDQDFVELERRPDDKGLLSSIFRTIHTIKGTCGFLGFSTLEAVTHRAENILSQLREGQRKLSPGITSLLLETADVVKTILTEIETQGAEPAENYQELCGRLQAVCDGEEPAPTSPGESAQGQAAARDGGEAIPEEPAGEATPTPAAEAEPQIQAAAVPDVPRTGESGEAREAAPGRSSIAESTIRVDVGLLDKLMNLVGELVLARNQILQYTSTQEDAGFSATSQRLNLITTELQANVMKTRMQPIGVVWNKFPRVVRDMGHSFGKQIDLEMEGAETELDKTIIEAIKDPLTHIIRNSCDHGLETPEERTAAGKSPRGHLMLRAYHEGGQVNIEISDDGAGIDPEKLRDKVVAKGLVTAERANRMGDRELLNLIFLPGFSTAQKVTNVSGRGVGMDVVKTNIEKIGGSIDLQSRKDAGTTIKIKIPLTLAIIPALVVSCSNERFAIPQVNLVELVRAENGANGGQQIENIHGAPVYRLRGKLLPLVYLNKILGLGAEHREDGSVNIIVLQADERTFGLVVDSVNDTAEIVVKPLGKLLKGINCYAGATIMGDGRVALILDVMGIAQLGHVVSEAREQALATQTHQSESVQERQAVLLFRAGSNDRLAVPLALVDRLEEFAEQQIEQSGSQRVVQYRGKILPLAPLDQILGSHTMTEPIQGTVQVIVFSEGSRRVGIIVDEIVDIVEEAIQIRSRTSRAGLLGSAVIGGKVTDFIDLHYLIQAIDHDWFGASSEGAKQGARILVAESSSFSRGLVRNFLEMAGYEVVEAAARQEAFDALTQHPVDLLISSVDLPDGGAAMLAKEVRSVPDLKALPILGLVGSVAESEESTNTEAALDAYQAKFDREAMLRSVEKLIAREPDHVLEQQSV